jgi:hypothetical protein
MRIDLQISRDRRWRGISRKLFEDQCTGSIVLQGPPTSGQKVNSIASTVIDKKKADHGLWSRLLEKTAGVERSVNCSTSTHRD